MPGILSYLLSPKGGPSHLGDSVAPETMGHMTVRLLAAANRSRRHILQLRIPTGVF